MPRRFDLSKIKDFETVCYIDTPLGRILNPITEALITFDVGVREITAPNAEETFRRHCVLAALQGPLLIRGDGSPWYITQNDVIAHIGLVTNNATLTEAAFKRAIYELLEDKAKQLRIKYRVQVKV